MSEVKLIKDIYQEIKQHSPNPEHVKLVAVSKKQSVEKINRLIDQGQKIFGENYVQEALEKVPQISKAVEWHFIGHLQTNKVKNVVDKTQLIHSVDTYKLATKIDVEAAKIGKVQKILLEVNIGNEESKSGFLIDDLLNCFSEILLLKNIQVSGLMCLPPISENTEETRKYFKQLKMAMTELRLLITSEEYKKQFTELSMGTSSDYLIALQEGATMIRLGTILFGERS